MLRDQEDVINGSSDDDFGFKMVSLSEADEAIGKHEDHKSVLGLSGQQSLRDEKAVLEGSNIEQEISRRSNDIIWN